MRGAAGVPGPWGQGKPESTSMTGLRLEPGSAASFPPWRWRVRPGPQPSGSRRAPRSALPARRYRERTRVGGRGATPVRCVPGTPGPLRSSSGSSSSRILHPPPRFRRRCATEVGEGPNRSATRHDGSIGLLAGDRRARPRYDRRFARRSPRTRAVSTLRRSTPRSATGLGGVAGLLGLDPPNWERLSGGVDGLR